jgi:hypothetical protein
MQTSSSSATLAGFNRVTRLGELSYLLVYFGPFYKNIIFGALFPQLKLRIYTCIIFDNNGLGHILGDTFTNPSGHTAGMQNNKRYLHS